MKTIKLNSRSAYVGENEVMIKKPEGRYLVRILNNEVTTPQFLSTIIEEEKCPFLSPDYPYIVVSKLTDKIIKAAIESFINFDENIRWLKLYHIMPTLDIKEIDEILF